MQTSMKKDPYQIVCQAFEHNAVQELLLGEKGYDYKSNFRSDDTLPEEKTDLIVMYNNIIRYYIAQYKNPLISQKIFEALMHFPETHWAIEVMTRTINREICNRKDNRPALNLNTDILANHLKNIIRPRRTELMQEKEFGGGSFEYGMYQYLCRVSKRCVENGGPAFVDENANTNDPFEAVTSFTLTLPGKIADLDSRLNVASLHGIKTILKGTPIPNGNGYIAAPDSSWTYTFEKDKQPTAETQLICMVNQLYSRSRNLLQLIADFDLKTQLDTIVWMHHPNQKMCVPLHTLEKLKAMDIPFSIEIRFKES